MKIELIKYGTITIVNYILMFLATFFLVEKMHVPENISYLFIISLVYIETYFLYTKFVFVSNFSKKSLIKYIIYLISFWFLNNIFFNLITEIFNVNYLLTILLNILILGFIKFFVQKNLVFNE